MLKKLVVTTMFVSVSLLAGADGTRLFANTFYEATVTFSDRLGDNITSDFLTTGNHTYVNGGADKLESGFWALSRDFVLRARTGPSRRYLAFSLTPITPAGAPTATLQEHDLFMNIRDILTMLPGSGKNTIALFNTSIGNLKMTPSWVDTAQYATQASVSRSANVWTVTADPGVPPGPGDVAALTKTKGNTESLVGLYHVPFQITITCVAAACP